MIYCGLNLRVELLKIFSISMDISRVESTNEFIDPLIVGVLKSLKNLLFKLRGGNYYFEFLSKKYQFTEIVDFLGDKDSKSHFNRNGNLLFRSNSLCNNLEFQKR